MNAESANNSINIKRKLFTLSFIHGLHPASVNVFMIAI